jgi:hypothetical protein
MFAFGKAAAAGVFSLEKTLERKSGDRSSAY